MLLNLLVQQPQMLGRIIENTPYWVWALLAGLLWLGGSQLLARNVSLVRAMVMPVLRALVQATGESAAYHVRQGRERLCLYRVDSPHPVRDHARAGDLLPLDKGAGGRVLVAFDPELGDWVKKQRNHTTTKPTRQQMAHGNE